MFAIDLRSLFYVIKKHWKQVYALHKKCNNTAIGQCKTAAFENLNTMNTEVMFAITKNSSLGC